ncbi:MAG: sensor domain-containing diguanylate cyclase [Idiomarina sp.]|nr:sensor domain-containing diguanylate cyclase [Idiomarina sp.]
MIAMKGKRRWLSIQTIAYFVFTLFTVTLLSSLAFNAQADTPLSDNWSGRSSGWVSPDIWFYKAEQQPNIEFSEVQTLAAEQWQFLGQEPVAFGYDLTPYWLRFTIEPADFPRVLQIEYPLLDDLQFFFVSTAGDVAQAHMGDRLPFNKRPVAADGFVVDIPSVETHEVYLRVETTSSLRVPVRIWETAQFHEAQGPRYVAIGLYFGVLICMVIYNLFGYAVTREASFFTYSIYVVFTGLLMAALSGVGFRYLWPNSIWLQDIAIIFFGGLAFVFATIFISQLLNLREHSKRWHRGLVLLGILAAGISVCSLFLPYSITIYMLLPFAVVACAYVMVLGMAMWARGMQHAQIFTLAWFAFLASIMFNSLGYLGILDGQFIQRYAIMLGSGIEVLLLSWVVTLMYSAERTERLGAQELALQNALAAEEAQRVLNEELEQRVTQRTTELESVSVSLQKANAELERKSNEDGLTGLFNRRFFDVRLHEEFNRSIRNHSSVSLVMLDIDHFKQLNDQHGHQVGDDILRQFSTRLRSVATRVGDVVCRYGGEEFAVILPATNAQEAEKVALRLLSAVREQPFTCTVGELTVTVSAGVASIHSNMNDPADLIKAADKALYIAKNRGRNQLTSAAL